MSYRLETQEALPAGIKRIALEQIDEAMAQLTPPTEDRDKAVHEARKSFKDEYRQPNSVKERRAYG